MKQETGNGKKETGNGKRETGNEKGRQRIAGLDLTIREVLEFPCESRCTEDSGVGLLELRVNDLYLASP